MTPVNDIAKQRVKAIYFVNTIMFIAFFLCGSAGVLSCVIADSDKLFFAFFLMSIYALLFDSIFVFCNLLLLCLPRFYFSLIDKLLQKTIYDKQGFLKLFIGFIGKVSYFPFVILPLFSLLMLLAFKEIFMVFFIFITLASMLIILIFSIIESCKTNPRNKYKGREKL